MKREKARRRLLAWILVFALMSGALTSSCPVTYAEETQDSGILISYSEETLGDETPGNEAQDSYTQDGKTQDDETQNGYTMYLTQVSSGGVVRTENILKDADGVWYFTTAAIERYTGYTFNEEKLIWRKYEDTESTDKQIRISPETGQVTVAMMETAYPFEGLSFPQYQGTWWFPIHVFLPIMEQLSYVDDGVLVIEGLAVTLEDALHDLDMDSLMFDPESEFAGMAWANSLMIGSSYLFDTIGSLSWERLTSAGTVADYETVFTDYLTDRDAYEVAYGEDSSLSDILDITDTGKSVAKKYKLSVKGLKTLRGVAESLQAKIADGEVMFEEDYFLTDTFDAIIPEWLFEGAQSVSDVVSAASTAYEIARNYATMVLDNREALAAVYPDIVDGYTSGGVHIFADSSSSELIQEAASNVYVAYTDENLSNVLWGVYQAVVTELEDELWANLGKLAFKFALKLPGYYSAAAAVEKEALDALFKKFGITASDDMALLNHHITVLENAKEAYTSARQQTVTQEHLQTLRRTTILTLLSSKKCFEIMRDNNTTYDEFVSYCDTRIQNIEERLALLYLAGDSVAMDGLEYFRSESLVLEDYLTELQVTDPVPETATWYDVYAQLSLSTDGTTYAYMEDLTGNGVYELIVADYPEDQEVCTLAVYTLQDQAPVQIYDNVGSSSHAGWKFICLAKNSSGQAGILEVTNSEWQGYKSCSYNFITFSADGTQTISDGVSWDDNGESGLGTEQIEYIMARYEVLSILLNTQYEFLTEGTSTIDDLCAYLSDFGITAADVSGKLEELGYHNVTLTGATDDGICTATSDESNAIGFTLSVNTSTGGVYACTDTINYEFANLNTSASSWTVLTADQANSALYQLGYLSVDTGLDLNADGTAVSFYTYEYTYLTNVINVDLVSGVGEVLFEGYSYNGYVDLRNLLVIDGDPLPEQETEQEVIYSEGLSKDYVEEELAAWLGTEFNEYTLYEETDESFTYLNYDTLWFITVYRLSGKVEYCNYRGVILDEMQIDGDNDSFSEYGEEYEEYYGIEDSEDDSYTEYIMECLLGHYWPTTLSDGTYVELSFSGSSSDLTMSVFVDIVTYTVPCSIDTGSGMDVYIDDGMALLEYLPSLFSTAFEYSLILNPETMEMYLCLNDSTIVIPAA